jgi:hypothetical protein
MAAIDYEAEYDNRAPVPEHPKIFEAGVATRYEAAADANHFTVLDPLADPDSAMVARLALTPRP